MIALILVHPNHQISQRVPAAIACMRTSDDRNALSRRFGVLSMGRR
jgi:hypothetical protein